MKVISHKPPRHFDDFLALVFLKSKYPNAEIEFIAPQDPVLKKYKNDKDTILVDVGGDYNPEMKNYDHHHNAELPCSFVLVIENEFPQEKEILNHPAVKFIDLSDRYGARKASEELGVPFDRQVDEMRKTVLLSEPYQDSQRAKETVEAFKNALQNSQDYNSFMKAFYEEMDKRGLLEEAKEKIRKQEEEFKRKIENAKVIEVNGLRVVYSKETFAPLHYRAFTTLNADLIIEKNSQNPSHTSIIKNTSSPKTQNIDLSKVFKEYPKIFIHNNGFIAVVDAPIEKVNPERIINLLED